MGDLVHLLPQIFEVSEAGRAIRIDHEQTSPPRMQHAMADRATLACVLQELHDADITPRRVDGELERELRRVEEEHLPDLRLDRVEPQRVDRGALIDRRHRSLELDAVGALHEGEDPAELLVGEDFPLPFLRSFDLTVDKAVRYSSKD